MQIFTDLLDKLEALEVQGIVNPSSYLPQAAVSTVITPWHVMGERWFIPHDQCPACRLVVVGQRVEMLPSQHWRTSTGAGDSKEPMLLKFMTYQLLQLHTLIHCEQTIALTYL